MKMALIAVLSLFCTACATTSSTAPPVAEAAVPAPEAIPPDNVSIGQLVDLAVYGCAGENLQCASEARHDLGEFFTNEELTTYRDLIPDVPDVPGDPTTFEDNEKRETLDAAMRGRNFRRVLPVE